MIRPRYLSVREIPADLLACLAGSHRWLGRECGRCGRPRYRRAAVELPEWVRPSAVEAADELARRARREQRRTA